MNKLELDREDFEECLQCGFSIDTFDDEGEYCDVCGDGPFCDYACVDEHKSEIHGPKCRACGKALEIDPPCPICHREFCDDCIGVHVKLCQMNEDMHLGLQPTLFSFIFEDGLTCANRLC